MAASDRRAPRARNRGRSAQMRERTESTIAPTFQPARPDETSTVRRRLRGSVSSSNDSGFRDAQAITHNDRGPVLTPPACPRIGRCWRAWQGQHDSIPKPLGQLRSASSLQPCPDGLPRASPRSGPRLIQRRSGGGAKRGAGSVTVEAGKLPSARKAAMAAATSAERTVSPWPAFFTMT